MSVQITITTIINMIIVPATLALTLAHTNGT